MIGIEVGPLIDSSAAVVLAVLSVDLAQDRVDAADDRDQVGDQAALGHHRRALQVDEVGARTWHAYGLPVPSLTM